VSSDVLGAVGAVHAIYDADGSLLGELRYLAGKLTGQASCALCEISHGLNPRGKRAWRTACRALPEVTWLHRDEQDDALHRFTAGRLPCVVTVRVSRQASTMLLTREQLAECHGDLSDFEQRLRRAVDSCPPQT
jgi:hypothetical protein